MSITDVLFTDRKKSLLLTLVLTLAASDCASSPVPAPVSGVPVGAVPGPDARPATPGTAPALPPVPAVAGAPLGIRVQYPADNQVIVSRDSNFVLGSVGSGDATLRINGIAVPVAPNGAFLAWLPNPPVAAARYELTVTRGADSVRRVLPIRYPAPRVALSPAGRLHVDTGSLSPSPAGPLRVRGNEYVRVSVRAPSNARAWIESRDGLARWPMVIATEAQASSLLAAQGARNAIAPATLMTSTTDVATTFATDVEALQLSGAHLVVARNADTVRLPVVAPALADTGARMVGVLRSTSTIGSDTDRVVIGRPTPDGTYKWLLLSGTIVEMTGVQGAYTRVRLDDALEVWVATSDIVTLPVGTPLPRRVTGGFRVNPSQEWVDVNIPIGERPAYYIEPDGKTLVLTLYRTQANPEISPIIGNDTLIRRIAWEQVSTDRLRMTFTLSRPVFGWLALWDESRRTFVLRLRRIPAINEAKPLAGLTIAVDPGHPPAGATGPTGLYEGDAVLPVGMMLGEILKARGANVVMTRTTRDTLGLTERTVTSRRANAHAFISIHLNALPDGVNPFTNNGTSTLFFHQNSEPLARQVQRALMQRFPLRDLGVHYQNLAVARPTWYPSALAEGLFVMLPEQEAAMRNPDFQRRYAEGLAAGLEAYFRELSRQ